MRTHARPRRRALVPHRCWPDRCPTCDRFLTRRAGSHRHRCTARALAGPDPTGGDW